MYFREHVLFDAFIIRHFIFYSIAFYNTGIDLMIYVNPLGLLHKNGVFTFNITKSGLFCLNKNFYLNLNIFLTYFNLKSLVIFIPKVLLYCYCDFPSQYDIQFQIRLNYYCKKVAGLFRIDILLKF